MWGCQGVKMPSGSECLLTTYFRKPKHFTYLDPWWAKIHKGGAFRWVFREVGWSAATKLVSLSEIESYHCWFQTECVPAWATLALWLPDKLWTTLLQPTQMSGSPRYFSSWKENQKMFSRLYIWNQTEESSQEVLQFINNNGNKFFGWMSQSMFWKRTPIPCNQKTFCPKEPGRNKAQALLYLPNLSANHPPKKEPIMPPGIKMAVVRDHNTVSVFSLTGFPVLSSYVRL